MKWILLVTCTLLSSRFSFCQSNYKDSLSDPAIKNAVDAYNDFTDGGAAIYNGKEYVYYAFPMEGDPYFISGNLTDGWVSYKNRVYDSLRLLYDVSRNAVVIAARDTINRLTPDNDFIDSFSLYGHTFIKLAENHQQNLYTSGFFDRLYNGHIRLFAKRVKTMNPQIKGNVVVQIFETKDRFYVYKDNLFYLLTNKKDMSKIFGDKYHEIRRRLRKEHIKVKRKNFETALTHAVTIYDQLTH